MTVEKMFPIQGGPVSGTDRYQPPGQVPWSIAEEAYKVYSGKYGTEQSLERIAERGGFGWSELVWLLQGGKK